MGRRVGHKRKQTYESRRRRIEKYDAQRDDRLDFPAHDDREDEERARYEAAGVHEDAAPGTEPC